MASLSKTQVFKRLSPQNQIWELFGNICNHPEILRNPKYSLDITDFYYGFHKMLFSSISNLIIKNGLKDVSVLDIENNLKQYDEYYEVWKVNDGPHFIDSAKQNANSKMFDNDYQIIKKYSVLRKIFKQGIDIRDIFDFTSDDKEKINEQVKKLNDLDITSIIDNYSTKISKIRNEVNSSDSNIKRFRIGDDIDDLINHLNDAPVMGYPFRNPFYNSLFRGMRQSKYMVVSASSGTGKTRTSLMDALSVSCIKMYEVGKGWIDNPLVMKSLFVSTELDKAELQKMSLAFVSGIETHDLDNGSFDKSTIERLHEAGEILKNSPLYVEYIEEFSIDDIDAMIQEYKVNHNIQYLFFDYIQNNAKLSKSIELAYGKNMRNDEVLSELSTAMKKFATKYNIFVRSGTQVNGNIKDEDPEISRTEYAISGSKAVINKADYGVIITRPTQKDLHALKDIIKEGFNNREPDYCHWIYKNRAGLKHIVIWTQLDLGNMREIPLFVTDYQYQIVDDIDMITATAVKNNEKINIQDGKKDDVDSKIIF